MPLTAFGFTENGTRFFGAVPIETSYNGSVVVLSGGICTNLEGVLSLAAHLYAKGIGVIACDPPLFDAGQVTAEAYLEKQFRNEAEATERALGSIATHTTVYRAGHSFGGLLGAFALSRPQDDFYEGHILSACGYAPVNDKDVNRLQQSFSLDTLYGGNPLCYLRADVFMPIYRAMSPDQQNAQLFKTQSGVATEILEARLPRLAPKPVLVQTVRDDLFVSPDSSTSLAHWANAIPDKTTLDTLDAGGHMVWLTAPQDVASSIARWAAIQSTSRNTSTTPLELAA